MPESPDTIPDDPLIVDVSRELRSAAPARSRAVEETLARLGAERSRRLMRRMALAAGIVIAAGAALLVPRAGVRPVRFSLDAPASARVVVVGDFNDWSRDGAPLVRRDGEWSVTLRLRPGRYRYAFLVDGGRWVADRARPGTDDDFDTPTSVITVAR
jgi:1,4-alpha-glucan branching enzyme